MKKKRITEEEFDEMVKEVSKNSNDNVSFGAKMEEIEDILRRHRHLKPTARLLIVRGALETNRGNPTEGLALYDRAIALAIAKKDVGMHALALRCKATSESEADEYAAAELNLKKAIELSYSIDHKYQVAACLHILSSVYLQTQDFEKYLETSEEALRMLRMSGEDKLVYARAYVFTMRVRTVHLLNLKLYDRALAALDEVMASPDFELAGEQGQFVLMITRGHYLTETAQYDKSNEVMLALLGKVEDKPVNTEIAFMHGLIAENMMALKKYKEAAQHIQVSEDYHRAGHQTFSLADDLLRHAELYLYRKKAKEAQACLEEAENLILAAPADYAMGQFYEKYATLYEKQGDHKKAYAHLLTAKKHQAASLRTDYDKRINSIAHRYELSEKEKQNQLLQKDIEMKKQELSMASDFLNQKVELLKEMKGFMKNMRKENIQKNDMMKALDRKIDSVINVEYEQQLFIEKIETSGNEFITRIRKKYPQLSLTEAKICSLLRNNFSNKEIANLLVTSLRTIENHRYRIRKKLGIKGDDSLSSLLNEI